MQEFKFFQTLLRWWTDYDLTNSVQAQFLL